MKVAVIQLGAGANKADNISLAQDMVLKAIRAKVKFVLLPEMFHYRGLVRNQRDIVGVSENLPGPSIKPLMALAAKHKVCILAGSIYEKAKNSKKAYNTSVLINSAGRIQACYRKKKLFKARIENNSVDEGVRFLAGKRKTLTSVGRFITGLSICYDLRFSEIYREYAAAGAEILCVPSAFTYQTGRAHWETLLRARAIETGCYVLAPNQCGKDAQGIRYYGNSMIVDPWGKVLARASTEKKEILFAHVSKDAIKEFQKVLPNFKKK